MRAVLFLTYLYKIMLVFIFLSFSTVAHAQSDNTWIKDAVELAKYIEDNKLILSETSKQTKDFGVQPKTLDSLYYDVFHAAFNASEDEFLLVRQTYVDEINRQNSREHEQYMEIFDLYRDFDSNKNYDTAMASLYRIIESFASSPSVKIRAHIMLGYAYYDLGQREKTIEAIQSIGSITNEYEVGAVVKNEIAEFESYILQAVGDRPGTVEAYQNQVKYSQDIGIPINGSNIVFNLLLMVMETSDRDAIVAFDEMQIKIAKMTENPKTLFRAYRTCATYSLQHFSTEKALSCLGEAQKYVKADPHSASSLHYSYAIAYARSGNAKLARKYFQMLNDDPKTFNIQKNKKLTLIAEAEVLLAENKAQKAFGFMREFIQQEKFGNYNDMQKITGQMRNYAQKQLSMEKERTDLLESQSTLQASVIKRQRISMTVGFLTVIGGVIFGIKQVKLTRKLRIARNDANNANRAKSEFLANMSHEIRTPMNGVLGMTEVLKLTELTDKQQNYADMIYKSGSNLMIILNDILDFSKIESGKLDLNPVSFDLKVMAEEIILLMAPTAKSTEIKFNVHYAENLPCVLIGDEVRIRQILTNLISNAIKFTKSGQVLLSLEGIQSGSNMDLTIKVVDTGIGIAEDKLKKIFESFTQAEGSTTRQFGGTGLGLTISRELTKAMGGVIAVTSKVGKGSTFTVKVSLPIPEVLDTEVQSLAPLPKMTSKPYSGRRILVVDDLDRNLSIIENILTPDGLSPTCVSSAQDAYTELLNAKNKGEPFDLVLLDYQMPRVNGIALAKKMSNDTNLAGTKIIMMSSADFTPYMPRLKQIAIVGNVMKPITAKALMQSISDVFLETDSVRVGNDAYCKNYPILEYSRAS